MGKIVGGVGVDGGGFIITSNGIIPVPPWDPMLRARLDAVALLVRTRELDSKAEIEPVVRQLIGEVAERLGAPGDGRVVYFSAMGYGFTSTADGMELCPVLWRERLRDLLAGKRPPIPIPIPEPQPWWVLDLASMDPARDLVGDAVAAGVVQQVVGRGIDLTAFLEAPDQVAQDLGITLPAGTVERIRELAPA